MGSDVFAVCVMHGAERDAACPRCGTFECARCLEEGPDERVCNKCRARDEGKRLSPKRYLWTLRQVIGSPREAFESARVSSTLAAVGFASCSVLLGTVVQSATGAALVRFRPDGSQVPTSDAWGVIAFWCVALSVLWLGWCVPEWLWLRLLGARDCSLRRQLSVASWCLAPVPIAAIFPCGGVLVAALWMLVLRIVGTCRMQRVQPAEAVLATLGPVLVFAAIFFGIRGDRFFSLY